MGGRAAGLPLSVASRKGAAAAREAGKAPPRRWSSRSRSVLANLQSRLKGFLTSEGFMGGGGAGKQGLRPQSYNAINQPCHAG